jgi:hypothetical protein
MKDVDRNFKSYADVRGIAIDGLHTDGLAGFDDALKFSHAEGCYVTNSVIGDGTQIENAIDMNRECKYICISDSTLHAGGYNAITIKGGCENIILKNLMIYPGGNCDIELGGWSDQSKNKTTKVHIVNVRRIDGKPIRLRVINADYPTVQNTRIEYQRATSLALRLLFKLREKFA